MEKPEPVFSQIFCKKRTSDDDEDVWNDELLITLYDKALQVAKKEVAQRIAMETNTKVDHNNQELNTTPDTETNSFKKKKNKGKGKKNKHSEWQEGWNCRAVYTEDGLEYEAIIKHILDDSTCIVSYIGYENEEVLALKELKPSWGKYAIIEQYEGAHRESKNLTTDGGGDEDVDEEEDVDEAHGYSTFKYENSPKKKHSNKYKNGLPQFNFPPFHPSLEFDNQVPPPPPMPFLGGNGRIDEDKALYPMLVSWYMSGYYTGLYQGQKMAVKSMSHHQPLSTNFKRTH